MTNADIQRLLDDESLSPLDVNRRLGSWQGLEFDLRLSEWTFHDFRPRDEWFYIQGLVSGHVFRLNLFVLDRGNLQESKKTRLFQIGGEEKHSPINIHAVVDGSSSTLSTGLFFAILDYATEGID